MKSHPARGSGPSTTGCVLVVKWTKTRFISFRLVTRSGKILTKKFSLLQGQPFCGPDIRVMLLGNPVLWWLNCVAIVYYLLVFLYHSIRTKRGYPDTKTALGKDLMPFLFCASSYQFVIEDAMTRVPYQFIIFTARVRSTGEGTVFTGVCLLTFREGVPHLRSG